MSGYSNKHAHYVILCSIINIQNAISLAPTRPPWPAIRLAFHVSSRTRFDAQTAGTFLNAALAAGSFRFVVQGTQGGLRCPLRETAFFMSPIFILIVTWQWFRSSALGFGTFTYVKRPSFLVRRNRRKRIAFLIKHDIFVLSKNFPQKNKKML